jgi:predicted Zn-dependent peptidase
VPVEVDQLEPNVVLDVGEMSERLVVKTGSGSNPTDKPGLANFTAEMLDEGAGSRSAPQMADHRGFHAA